MSRDQRLSPGALVESLQPAVSGLRGLARWKILYRPLICPFHRLLAEIPRGARCFDIGCGAGTLLWLIEQHRSPDYLAGVEIEEKLVDQARSMVPRFSENISIYDGYRLPWSLGSCDFVILNDVLHHIPKNRHEDFLAELKTRMRPGSRLILKDIDAGRKFLVYGNKLHDLILAGECGDEISMARAGTLLESCGFEVLQREYLRMYWYPHFIFWTKA